MPVWNFAAGPARIPDPVLIRAKSELMNWQGSGLSVMEMSHRSAEFDSIIKKAEEDLRKLLNIPKNYQVIFTQGGGTTQFAAVPLNLLNSATWNAPVDYVVTGTWSKKAYEEAKKYVKNLNLAADTKASNHTTIPPRNEWKTSPGAAYLYYCNNETIHGVEFHDVPDNQGSILAVDMSSDLLSRPIDVSKYGLIFAGAQKNIGPAGLTIIIVREDLVGGALPCTPSMLDYKQQADNKSLLNTPPTFAIYMAGLVFDWLLNEVGGLDKMAQITATKSGNFYKFLDGSGGFFSSPVDPKCRSNTTIPFRLKGGDEAIEAKFIGEAKKAGFLELKGHRSVGGCRAGLYNAMPLEGVEALMTFMAAFMQKESAVPAAPSTTAVTTGGGLSVESVTKGDSGTREAGLHEMKVLIADKTDPVAVNLFGEAGITAEMKPGLKEDELCAIMGEYDALVVRSATKVTPKIIKAGAKLKIIGRAGVGVDNIDLPAATECGVIVVNSPQGNTTSAAEHTWGMILAMARKIPQAHSKLVGKGEWDRTFVGCELETKTLGILGFGNVGKKVARYALAFGMKVFAYDPFVTAEQGSKLGVTMMELDQVIAGSDVITLHLPAIKETLKMINSRTIATMKKGVLLANVARGECVDENDLFEALKSGHVGAAALDVYAPEPLSPESPLLTLPNIVLTPHLGASTKEAQIKVAVDVVQQIIEVFKGGPAQAAVNIPTMKPHLITPVQHLLGVAEKLGRLISQLAVGAITKLTLSFNGLIADVDTSPLATCFLKGVLDPVLAERVNFVNAPGLAASRGLQVETIKDKDGKGYESIISASATCRDGSVTQLSGTYFANRESLVSFNGLPIEIPCTGWMMFISSPDVPGMIGKVGTVLGSAEVNIASMEVGRYAQGEMACMVLTVDKEVSDAVCADLCTQVPQIKTAKVVRA